MANFFDQFDPPQRGALGTKKSPNFFDQFDNQLPPGFELEQPTPQRGALGTKQRPLSDAEVGIGQPKLLSDKDVGLDASGLPPGFELEQPSGGYLGTAVDVAKQLGSGLVEGAASIPAFVPTVASLAGQGVDWLSNKFNLGLVDPQKEARDEQLRAYLASHNPLAQVSAALPQPETTGGEIARSVGNFLPSAAGSAGRLGANLVSGATAGLGAYGGEQAAQGLGLDPRAGAIAGSLIGGAGGLRAGENLANNIARRTVEPASEILGDADIAYRNLRDANRQVVVTPETMGTIKNKLLADLQAYGPARSQAPGVYGIIDDLDRENGGTVADLVDARRNLHSYFGVKGPDPNKPAAAIALPGINGAIGEIAPPGTLEALRQADANWSAGRIAQAVNAKEMKAEGGAETENSGLNLGNKVRQNIKSFIQEHTDPFGQVHGLTPSDLAALESVRKGTSVQNAMRTITSIAGGGGGPGALVAGAAGVGGLLGLNAAGATEQNPGLGALIPVAGMLGRVAYNRSVMQAARNAEAMIRARSPYAQSLGQSGPQPRMALPQTLGRLGGILGAPNFAGLPSPFGP